MGQGWRTRLGSSKTAGTLATHLTLMQSAAGANQNARSGKRGNANRRRPGWSGSALPRPFQSPSAGQEVAAEAERPTFPAEAEAPLLAEIAAIPRAAAAGHLPAAAAGPRLRLHAAMVRTPAALVAPALGRDRTVVPDADALDQALPAAHVQGRVLPAALDRDQARQAAHGLAAALAAVPALTADLIAAPALTADPAAGAGATAKIVSDRVGMTKRKRIERRMKKRRMTKRSEGSSCVCRVGLQFGVQ